jgi:hypothetical protein
MTLYYAMGILTLFAICGHIFVCARVLRKRAREAKDEADAADFRGKARAAFVFAALYVILTIALIVWMIVE